MEKIDTLLDAYFGHPRNIYYLFFTIDGKFKNLHWVEKVKGQERENSEITPMKAFQEFPESHYQFFYRLKIIVRVKLRQMINSHVRQIEVRFELKLKFGMNKNFLVRKRLIFGFLPLQDERCLS